MICKGCGVEFKRTKAQSTKTYCTSTCKMAAAKRRNTVPIAIVVQAPCIVCGGAVTPQGHRMKKFCDESCRTKFYRRKRTKQRQGKAFLPPRLAVPPAQDRIWRTA